MINNFNFPQPTKDLLACHYILIFIEIGMLFGILITFEH